MHFISDFKLRTTHWCLPFLSFSVIAMANMTDNPMIIKTTPIIAAVISLTVS